MKIQSTFATDVSFKDCLFHNHASFSFSTFKGVADFSRAIFLRFADFVKVEFQYTQFHKTEFKEYGSFDQTIFWRHALFQESSISNPFFVGARFEEGVLFNGCNIEGGNLGAIYKGDVDFGETKFHSVKPTYVYFGKAKFSGRTRFVKCTFDTLTYLNDICFTESAEAQFEKCDFPLGANFDGTVFSHITFHESKFGGPAYFRKSKFLADADFKRASFESLSDFSEAEFMGITDFSEAEFKIASFSNAKFHITSYFRTKFYETIFRDTEFVGETKFHFTFFEDQEHTIFNRTNMENVSFLNTDISRIKFDSVKWGFKNGFKIFEERMIEDKLVDNKEYQFDFSLDDVLTIYRNLRENYEFRLKYEEAGQFFVREMEIKRNYKEDGTP